MLIRKNQSKEEEMVKNAFFSYSPAVIIGVKKVTNLFQIGIFPHKKGQICPFQHEQFCNVKKKNF